MKKKKIIITQRITKNSATGEVSDSLDVNWTSFLKKVNLLPVAIPSGGNVEDFFSEFAPSGIILTGGNDLNKFGHNPLSARRDNLERKIIKAALKKSLPIYAVCRGMQMVVDYFEGCVKETAHHVRVIHEVLVEKKSNYSKILPRNYRVNSFHNYAVISVPPEFHIVARGKKDLTIEAVSHKKYKIWCQMWHPERNHPFNDYDLKIIKDFFRAQ